MIRFGVSVSRVGVVSVLTALVVGSGCGGIVDEVESAAPDASVEASTSAPTGEAAVGSACSSKSDCSGGDVASLLTCEDIHNGVPFPFGYCTETCAADSQCPSGSFCGVSPYDLGDLARCMSPCGTGGGACRADYTCIQVADIDKSVKDGCWTIPAHH